jgi:protein-ribulosamine 3-kinase
VIDYEQIELPAGQRGFRKFIPQGSSACFLAEAEGLAAIAATRTVATPRVISVNNSELITELIDSGPASNDGWCELGRQLADMHLVTQPCFGFTADNYCGATPQINTHCADGNEFFAEYRLNYQGRLARDSTLLDSADIRLLESISGRLEQLVPLQAPALLHGDLWRGNVLFDTSGKARLIDPACYWGWPEAELGMTTLFGPFDPGFYRAYAEHMPLQPGWRERLPLYNLYHLLNHLNLFGASYYAQVKAILLKLGG